MYDGKLFSSCWCLFNHQANLSVKGGGKWFQLVKAEVLQNGVDVRTLGDVDLAGLTVTLYLKTEHPMELPKVRQLDMLSEIGAKHVN